MLASVDGVIGPADEARISVTDEGLTCAATARSR